jgi:hypothetical protein
VGVWFAAYTGTAGSHPVRECAARCSAEEGDVAGCPDAVGDPSGHRGLVFLPPLSLVRS